MQASLAVGGGVVGLIAYFIGDPVDQREVGRADTVSKPTGRSKIGRAAVSSSPRIGR
jgi:hypothetical protein